MKANIDKWEGLHQEMIDGAKALVSQGIPGKEGISRINQVETRFLQEFNKYVGIYNSVLRLTVDQKKYWKGEGEIKSVEAKLAEIEKQFRAIPTVWY